MEDKPIQAGSARPREALGSLAFGDAGKSRDLVESWTEVRQKLDKADWKKNYSTREKLREHGPEMKVFQHFGS